MKLEEAASILGVSVDTPVDILKSKYRQLALDWHPDKCKKTNAKETFQQISIAYTKLISAHSVGGHRQDGVDEFDGSNINSGDESHEMAAFMRMFMDLVGIFNESSEPLSKDDG
jgi:DnaJ-class molecular chaperone